MTISIIGTGRVGTALGTAFADAGHRVVYGSRQPRRNDVRDLARSIRAQATTPADAVRDAGAVVLATPWEATEATVRGLDLAGTVVLDATSPLAWPGLEPTAEPSGGELVQSWAPDALVAKAFCTVGADVMADPAFAGRVRPAMLVASDHAEARRTAIALADQIGFEGLDAGGLERSRHLEHLAALWVHLAQTGAGRESAFGLLRR